MRTKCFSAQRWQLSNISLSCFQLVPLSLVMTLVCMLASLLFLIKGQGCRQLFFAMDIVLFGAPTQCAIVLQLISPSWSDCIETMLQCCNYRVSWCLRFSSQLVLYTAILFDCFAAVWNNDVATVPVAPIDLKVNLAAGSEFWQGQPTVERGARLQALCVFRQCSLVK